MSNIDKCTQVLLYYAQNGITYIPDIYKSVYMADKNCLQNCGRLVYGETYKKGENNTPIPITMRNLIINGSDTFVVKGLYIKPLRNCDTDFLSEADINSIEESMDSFKIDEAINCTPIHHIIPLEEIVKTLEDAENILSYLDEKGQI